MGDLEFKFVIYLKVELGGVFLFLYLRSRIKIFVLVMVVEFVRLDR